MTFKTRYLFYYKYVIHKALEIDGLENIIIKPKLRNFWRNKCFNFEKDACNFTLFCGSFYEFFYFRSSHPEGFCKKGALKILAKFLGKHLCQSLFFNKVAVIRRLWHRHFSANFAKFLKTPFL